MAETITDGCSGISGWRWHAIMRDLAEQGGLEGVTIDPLSVREHTCAGRYQGNGFVITWIRDVFMLLTMERYDQALINAFAKVLEYEPFCRYDDQGDTVTVEWDKKNPDGRFDELVSDGKSNLQRLQPVA